VKLKTIVLILVFITIFNSCKDISFNNPLDPNASNESAKLIKIIKTSVSGNGDIDYDDGQIWKATNSGYYYLLDIESGMIIRTIIGKLSSGISTNKGKIYVCTGENNIPVYDSLSGELLKQILTTKIYPKYCAFLNDKLIVFDYRSHSIFNLDIETGEAIRLFEVSGIVVSGLCTYKGGVLIIDNMTDSIYFYSMNGEVSKVFHSPAKNVTGITKNDNNIIFISDINGQIYKVSLP